MTVTTATFPFGDRFAIIGDAVGSRLNKDGLYSAHATASRLAQTVLHEGIDKQALARGYGKTVKWLVADNRFGRMVFAASRVAFTMPVVSRIVYQAFATEYKVRDERSRPLSVSAMEDRQRHSRLSGSAPRDVRLRRAAIHSRRCGGHVKERGVRAVFRHEMGGVRTLSDRRAEGEARMASRSNLRQAWEWSLAIRLTSNGCT